MNRASIIPYLRYDETDDDRSLADLREAYWASEAEDYELLLVKGKGVGDICE